MMRQFKKLGTLLMAAALTLSLATAPKQAAAGKSQPVEKQRTIRLGLGENLPRLVDHSLNLRVGESKTIQVKNCGGLKVTYKSGDKSIATVSKTGKVKAKKEGRVYISVIAKTKKGDLRGNWSCRIDVKPALTDKKTVKKTIDANRQLQIQVFKTVKNAEMEITITTDSEDENLKLDIGIVEKPNNYSAKIPIVDHITPDKKEVTIKTSKKVVIWNDMENAVDVTVKVKTADGKKTIQSIKASVV